jgi:hypothetical protein
VKNSLFAACAHCLLISVTFSALVPASIQADAGREKRREVDTATTSPDGAQSLPPPLRYRWQPKTSYVYSVHVEADMGAEIEIEDGNLIYEVRNINDLGTTLGWRGALAPQIRSKDGKIRPFTGLRMLQLFHAYGIPSFPVFGRPNEIQVSAQGIQLSTQGAQPLPRALGDLPLLPIELLPDTPKPTWEYADECSVTVRTHRGLVPTPALPFPRPNRFGHRSLLNRETEDNYPAHEETHYLFVRMDGANALITKQYNLSTRAHLRGQALLQLTGDGQFTFDTSLGVPRALSFKATLIDNLHGEPISTPITVSYHLLEGAERDRALAPPPPQPATLPNMPPNSQRDNTPNNQHNEDPNNSLNNPAGKQANPTGGNPPGKSRGKVPPMPVRIPLSEADLDHNLQELRSPEAFPRHIAADRIGQAEPISKRRGQVLNALRPLLEDKDDGVRTAAIKAMAAWADLRDSRVNADLIRLLDDSNVFIRWATLDALGTRGTPQTAAGVARVLRKERLVGMNALRHMGAVAAPALIPYLQDEDAGLRVDVCRLLKDIGTKHSLKPLEHTAAQDKDEGVRREAQAAIAAIQNR